MGKTSTEILTEMDAIQASIPALLPLNSASSSAIYKLMKYLFALASEMLYKVWDGVKAEISGIAASQIIGTKEWYVSLALGYFGGTLVQRASCLENGTKVILKVATLSSGLTAQLTNAELAGLRTYIKTNKVVGTDIDVISQTADLLDLTISVQYTGVEATVRAAIVTAIKDYLANLAFDSNLSKSLLENEILGIVNVLDASVDILKVDYGTGYQIISGNLAAPDAGYFEVGQVASVDLITLNMYL